MVWPTRRLIMTNTVLTTLGKMCRYIIAGAETPATVAMVTKSLSFTFLTSPRTSRANLAQTFSMMATMTLINPAPIIATLIKVTVHV